MNQLKIVCIGAAAVGKTTLLNYIANPTMDKKEYKPTQAIEVLDIELPSYGVSFRAWDFSGQEYLREYQSLHFKGADGAIIVFDLMRKDTLDVLIDWIRQLLRVTGPIPMVLVGNKIDLRETAVKELMVTSEEGNSFASELSKI
ncbi:MAG: Rab family GTPase, partial [Candidatus Hodarchaeales archaeon]